jgi:short subunit dehydrogenase-like uncharacterized protein
VTTDRSHDLVLFGATGYTGCLTAEYLARHAPPELDWAIAGRDSSRLEALAARLAHLSGGRRPAVLQADANDPASMTALARSAHVVATTVGPYARYGRSLVAACAEHGTHYCDLSGEVTFVRDSIDRNHARAVENGVKIVHSCGLDSIPSDLGVLLLAGLFAESGARLTRATTYVGPLRGAVSGGTIASGIALLEDAERDPAVRALLADPHALQPEDGQPRTTFDAPQAGVRFEPSIGEWTAPFFMAAYNTRVVRRTNALLGYPWGRDFRYEESSATGPGPAGFLAAGAIAVGSAGVMLASSSKRVREALKGFLPSPGSGPSRRQLDAGYFRYRILGEAVDEGTGGRLTSTVIVGALTDPGYAETAKMLAESALAMAVDKDRLPARSGVLTPASALGTVLIDRLREAGMTFHVGP